MELNLNVELFFALADISIAHAFLHLSFSRNPPPAKKRPPAAPKPSLPKVKAMFDYDATDTDELTFKENDIIEVFHEGVC